MWGDNTKTSVTPIYTKKEVAILLSVSEKTIDRLVIEGRLCSTKVGRRRMFTPGHINRYIEEGEI
jgi:excisionase family DNA binding protein